MKKFSMSLSLTITCIDVRCALYTLYASILPSHSLVSVCLVHKRQNIPEIKKNIAKYQQQIWTVDSKRITSGCSGVFTRAEIRYRLQNSGMGKG